MTVRCGECGHEVERPIANWRALFWLKVYPRGDCWEWRGSRHGSGYGVVRLLCWTVRAHRLAYEFAKGPIGPTAHIDHLCRHPWCVKPSHLEAVTQRVNTLRGSTSAAQNARKEKCNKGHPFDAANTYRTTKGRSCRTCHRDAERLRRSRA